MPTYAVSFDFTDHGIYPPVALLGSMYFVGERKVARGRAGHNSSIAAQQQHTGPHPSLGKS